MKTTSEQKRLLAMLAMLLCIGVIAAGVLVKALAPRSFLIFASPTPRPRPNYSQILEANGFVFHENDGAGDPIYIGRCGCIVIVNPDHVGFGAEYSPGFDCPMQELGAIINVMYPSEVLDFISKNLKAVMVKKKLVEGKAAGFEIAMIFNKDIMTVTIKDPR